MGLALIFTLPSFAKKPIFLSGQWDRDARSIIPQLPIRAWIEDNNKDLSLEVIGENIARDLYERLGFKTHYRRMILKINDDIYEN